MMFVHYFSDRIDSFTMIPLTHSKGEDEGEAIGVG